MSISNKRISTQIKINNVNDSENSQLKLSLPLTLNNRKKSYIQSNNSQNNLNIPSLPSGIHTPKHLSQNVASLKQFLTSDARSPAIKLLKTSVKQTPNQIKKQQKGMNFSEQIELIQTKNEQNGINESRKTTQRTEIKRMSGKLQSIISNPYHLKYEDHSQANISQAKEFVTQFDHKLQVLKIRNWEKFKFFNKEKILEFIHNKKSQHKLKYNQKMLDSQKPSPIVQKGTISIMLNDHKNHESFDLSKLSSHIPTKSKFKMKWKVIQWLIHNKNDEIYYLCKNIEKYLTKFQNKMNCNLNRQEFEELLKQVGIGGDSGLINKIFYIFDYDGNGTIDFKELIMGLEIFKKDPIENKVKIFLRICDKDAFGYISDIELYNVLKKNTQNKEEKAKYKTVCKQIFNEASQMHRGKLHYAVIYQNAIENRMLRTLLEQNIQNVQYVDQVIDADLEEAFHQQPSVTLNFEKLHEGIHFPEVNKILKMYKDYEQHYYEGQKIRQAYQF